MVEIKPEDKSPLKNLSRFTVRHFVRSVIGEDIKTQDMVNIIDSTIDNPRGSARKQFAAQDVKLTTINTNVLSVKDDTKYIRAIVTKIDKRLKKLGGLGGPSSPSSFLDTASNFAGLSFAWRLASRAALPIAAGLGLAWLLTTKDGQDTLRSFARTLDNIKKGKSFNELMNEAAARQSTQNNKPIVKLTEDPNLDVSGGKAALAKRLAIIKKYQQSLKNSDTSIYKESNRTSSNTRQSPVKDIPPSNKNVNNTTQQPIDTTKEIGAKVSVPTPESSKNSVPKTVTPDSVKNVINGNLSSPTASAKGVNSTPQTPSNENKPSLTATPAEPVAPTIKAPANIETPTEDQAKQEETSVKPKPSARDAWTKFEHTVTTQEKLPTKPETIIDIIKAALANDKVQLKKADPDMLHKALQLTLSMMSTAYTVEPRSHFNDESGYNIYMSWYNARTAISNILEEVLYPGSENIKPIDPLASIKPVKNPYGEKGTVTQVASLTSDIPDAQFLGLGQQSATNPNNPTSDQIPDTPLATPSKSTGVRSTYGPSTTAMPAPPTGKGSASDNAKLAMDWYMSKEGGGFTRAQAAGIVGNMQGESGQRLNPRADNGLGFLGIAQWSRARQADFKRVMGKSVADSTIQEQLQFSTWELTDPSSKLRYVGDTLRATNSVNSASDVMFNQYEAPGDNTGPRRASYAQNLYNSPTTDTASPSQTASIATDNKTPTSTSTNQENLPDDISLNQNNRFSVASGHLKGINPKLVSVMKAASRDLPPGYNIEMTSGLDARGTGTQNHPHGLAMDVQIYHYVNGKKVVLPNEGFGPGLKMYESLYQSVYERGKVMYPKDKFIWGGAWVSKAAGTGDRMHYQIVDPSVKGSAQGMGAYDPITGFGPKSSLVQGGAASTPEELAADRAQAAANLNAEMEAEKKNPDLTPKVTDTGQVITDTAKPVEQDPNNLAPVENQIKQESQNAKDDTELQDNLKSLNEYLNPSTTGSTPTTVTPNTETQISHTSVPSSVGLAIAKTVLPPGKSRTATAFYRVRSRTKTGGYPLDLPIGDPDLPQSRFA